VAVHLIHCGPAVNASEQKAFRFLKSKLESEAIGDEWILLTNLNFSKTSTRQFNEIDVEDYGFFNAENQEMGNLWESEQPSVIRLHSTQNDMLQRAFAYLVFYGLYKDMFRRGVQRRITHALIFDEAHRAARLKLIPTMAKESAENSAFHSC